MSSDGAPDAISVALRLFDDQPLGIRAFVRARHLLCPLSEVERSVPRAGRVLELGCGHGLFSALMAVAAPERSILGVDPSEVKIATASRLASKLPNVEFIRGSIDDIAEKGLDAVAIVDVLYLLPLEEKLRILERCRSLLKPGGSLVLKTNDTHPAWKFWWAWFQEVAMTRIGLTMGHGTLHFVGCTRTVDLLRRAGFDDVRVAHLPTLLPYPHTLFSCTR